MRWGNMVGAMRGGHWKIFHCCMRLILCFGVLCCILLFLTFFIIHIQEFSHLASLSTWPRRLPPGPGAIGDRRLVSMTLGLRHLRVHMRAWQWAFTHCGDVKLGLIRE